MNKEEIKAAEQKAGEACEVAMGMWRQEVQETSFLDGDARDELLELIRDGIETDKDDSYDAYMCSDKLRRGFNDETDEYLVMELFRSQAGNVSDVLTSEWWTKHGEYNLACVAAYGEYMKEVNEHDAEYANPER